MSWEDDFYAHMFNHASDPFERTDAWITSLLERHAPPLNTLAIPDGDKLTAMLASFGPDYASMYPEPDIPMSRRTEPLVGFRVWTDAGFGILGSTFKDYLWTPDVNEASCDIEYHEKIYPNIPVPHRTTASDCGFHAFFKLPVALAKQCIYEQNAPHQTFYVGSVIAFGRVMKHGETGMRSSKMLITGLLKEEPHLEAQRKIVKNYGIRYWAPRFMGKYELFESLAHEMGSKP